MTISKRILLMVCSSLLALLIVGMVGLSVAGRGGDSLRQINDDNLASIQSLAAMRQSFMETRVGIFSLLLSNDDQQMDLREKSIKANENQLFGQLTGYDKYVSGADERKLLDEARTAMTNYYGFFNAQLLPRIRNYETEYASQLIRAQAGPLGEKALKSLGNLIDYNGKVASETTQAALENAARGQSITIAVMLIGVLAVGALGFYLVRDIKSSLSRIQGMVLRVENELDFRVRVEQRGNDEIGQTTAALNRLLGKLQDNLSSIARSTDSVSSAANLMASTSSQVATASRQQSESASGMAATVEEMTVSINHVADRAVEANRISYESGQLAISGERVIAQTVCDIQDISTTVRQSSELINGLEAHSRQISKVVAVIKEVAEQTNLLALNAAIEAARAGEQGRGFAVVADEVRKLAERTAASTSEIASTIEAMHTSAGHAVSSMNTVIEKVSRGVERAQEANGAMRQIGEGSRNAVGMVEEITTAIREQGSATNSIATQVERIAQMSEESSAAAGNSAEAAHELDRLAKDVQSILRSYTL